MPSAFRFRSEKKPLLWIAFVCLASPITWAQSRSWDELQTLKHNYEMEVFQKDGQCNTGVTEKVTPTSLVVTFYGKELANGRVDRQTKEINKSDVLALGSGHNILYSGRSSWIDVGEAKPSHAEWLSVTTTGGEQINGSVIAITDSALSLSVMGRERSIPKSEAKTIDYVRQRPFTQNGDYLWREAPELLIFSPDVWLRSAGVSPKLHVRLYDSALPEDDGTHPCR